MTNTTGQTTEIESPIQAKAVVDGYRVERIISVREGLHTLAEATAPTGERVTLKVFAAPLEGKELRSRAAKLAKIQSSIAHPNVLPLVGNGKSREHLCLSGAASNATTLADRLRDGPLGAKDAVTLLSQVAGGLDTAHKRGLAHRALSPAAIIVTADQPPKALLTDFGITVPDTPGCQLNAALEDVDYRSPEEIRGEPPTPESTVYSLACILVACLTGAPPYPYYRPVLALHAHLVEKPPRVSERNPDLPSELDAVVGQALSKDPRERFSSPVALMRAVQRAVGVEAPIPGPSAPKRQETPRAAKRESPAPARRPAGETKEAPATPPAKPKSEAAPAPSREADEASHAARSRAANPFRRARRGDQGNRRREGGRSAVRRLAPTWAGIALVASALAGFATGNGDADDSKPRATANTVPAGQASRPASEPTKPVVGPVVERLDERRAAARRRMRAARRPAGQKAAAGDLAEIYRDARRSILNAPGEATSEGRLADHMLSVERAYRSLASAAREGPREWQRASDVVLERERDLELLLRTRSWI